MKRLFITGTDTEVGKTWVSCQIIRQLQSAGHSVGAYKPVCSGAVEQDFHKRWEDIAALLDAVTVDQPDDPDWIDRICPQRFDAPLAPNIAARLENRTVDDDQLVSGLSRWNGLADYIVIEGAGGLLSPVSDRQLVADLAVRLNTPLVIVAANRLGCIHQTLATIEAALSRGLEISALVLNCVTPSSDAALNTTNEAELRRLLPDVRLLVTDHQGALSVDGDDLADWFANA